MTTHYLDRLFAPTAIAVFGANERPESVAGRIYDNLRHGGFEGAIYAVNPKHREIYQQPCYRSLKAIGKPVDLAVIATPAPTIPAIIDACGKQGVRAAIVISAGFHDSDKQGKALKKSMLETAARYGMRLLGPNCLGLIRPLVGMNATFSKNTAAPGQLALVSQSGALCTSIMDWAITQDIGFSAIVSLGNAADIGFGDLLDYLAQDPHTRSILLYVEGIRDARSFISGLRIAARMKPVVLIKSGRHAAGSRAAMTHTGAMVGADDVFDAALQRTGVVRARTIEQLFSAAQLLATHNRVSGNRLAIITNGGGLGVMATDRAIDLGISIARLSAETMERLNRCMPPHWSLANPVDLLGDADESRYRAAVGACLEDPGVDGVLVMLSPQAMTDPVACAEAVIEARNSDSKPVLACWMGQYQVEAANKLFARHHLPSFPNPESSVEAFACLAWHYQNQQLLMQVPGPLAKRSEPDIDAARQIIQAALADNRSLLSATESKALLQCFAIPVTASRVCRTLDEVLESADSLGYPLAMKIHSRDISHKSDVGGIKLGIRNASALREAYQEMLAEVSANDPQAIIEGVALESMYLSVHGRELLIGVISDPVFGPAITFGAGGIQVEIMRDRAVAIPPLNRFLVEKMINQTHVARMLGKFRNMPAINMEALVQVLRRVSEMVCELPQIRSLDINPLVADEHGVKVLDARIVVEAREPSADPYDHMAIHPYPSHLVSEWQQADGTSITIRPIRPEDASIEQSFVRELSTESRYFRFMGTMNELTQQMLIRFTQLDYDRELALIAVYEQDGKEIELGVARYVINADRESCEFALVVADKWHNRGIGTRLMTALIDAARARGLKIMNGEIMGDNKNMLQLVKKLGFSIDRSAEDMSLLSAEITL
ncbi:MAG: bifunctional acetate--CoA ligase family protein/GNAT family N-acetyltransferase [Gammaproteobacteria bacterium]|jgi:acetyltransferase|nr:bifunctional acetate--CoA ligase family protein/GNAT family N-acetyltransferase [Gammaproteobacteria bacterium]